MPALSIIGRSRTLETRTGRTLCLSAVVSVCSYLAAAAAGFWRS